MVQYLHFRILKFPLKYPKIQMVVIEFGIHRHGVLTEPGTRNLPPGGCLLRGPGDSPVVGN